MLINSAHRTLVTCKAKWVWLEVLEVYFVNENTVCAMHTFQCFRFYGWNECFFWVVAFFHPSALRFQTHAIIIPGSMEYAILSGAAAAGFVLRSGCVFADLPKIVSQRVEFSVPTNSWRRGKCGTVFEFKIIWIFLKIISLPSFQKLNICWVLCVSENIVQSIYQSSDQLHTNLLFSVLINQLINQSINQWIVQWSTNWISDFQFWKEHFSTSPVWILIPEIFSTRSGFLEFILE